MIITNPNPEKPTLGLFQFANSGIANAITRHFITFSAMDGGHAAPSSPIALQAGDKVIAKTMLKAGTSHRWIFNYAADTSDPRRFIFFLNASSGGVIHYQSSLASEVRVDNVAIANVSQSYTDADLHTVEIDISGDALIDKIGSHDQVFESFKVVRNGQLIHDFDFNIDSSTDTIIDKAGSNITFSLVNVLPEMRVKYEWSDTYNGWLKFGDTRPYYFFGSGQHALVGDVNLVAGQLVRFKYFNVDLDFTLVSRAENSELVHTASGNIHTSWTVSSATLDGEPLVNNTPVSNDGVHHEIELVLGQDTSIYAIGGNVRNFSGLGGVVYDFAIDDGSAYSFALDDTDGIARNSGSGADGTYVGAPQFVNFIEVVQ